MRGYLFGKTAAVLQRINNCMQPPASEHGNMSHSSTGSGCLSGTVVAASKTVWVKHRPSKGQGRVLRKERSRGSKHRVLYIACPSGRWDSLVCAAITLYNRAAQPWPQHNTPSHDLGILSTRLLALHGRRGFCPAQGKERYVCSELFYMGLLDYLRWVKDSRQLRFTGLFCKQRVL